MRVQELVRDGSKIERYRLPHERIDILERNRRRVAGVQPLQRFQRGRRRAVVADAGEVSVEIDGVIGHASTLRRRFQHPCEHVAHLPLGIGEVGVEGGEVGKVGGARKELEQAGPGLLGVERS